MTKFWPEQVDLYQILAPSSLSDALKPIMCWSNSPTKTLSRQRSLITGTCKYLQISVVFIQRCHGVLCLRNESGPATGFQSARLSSAIGFQSARDVYQLSCLSRHVSGHAWHDSFCSWLTRFLLRKRCGNGPHGFAGKLARKRRDIARTIKHHK